MSYTAEDQVNNSLNKYGADFINYTNMLADLEKIAAACDGTAFDDWYAQCVKQMTILERIVKQKFTTDGEEIKND
jgi:hypothetical protein